MKKIAVLSSGGLDSYIAYRYAQTIHPGEVGVVFVNYGQPYYLKEKRAVETLHENDDDEDLTLVTADLAHFHLNNVPTVQQQEVFGRNLLLAFYGALVAPKVWMVALETEINPTAVRDKQPEFFHMTSGLLSFLLKGRQLGTTIESPFSHLTKTEEVKLGLDIGITCEEILTTVSCYDPDHQNCGRCSTCFKRWIALSNNGIKEEYAFDPLVDNDYGKKIVKEMRDMADEPDHWMSRYSMKRRIETHNALIREGWKGIWKDDSLR